MTFEATQHTLVNVPTDQLLAELWRRSAADFTEFKKGGIVYVDFDGVLNSYKTRGPALVDEPEPGAIEFIYWLIEQGLNPVIFTTRAMSEKGTRAVETWLMKWQFPPLPVTATKAAALAYIDDRAIRYEARSGDWESVKQQLRAMTTLNSRRDVPDVFTGADEVVFQDTNA